ncbi:Agmatinase [hydrothermal vent metagenome]|uniref:Agmatinase n=1 Tax=hydrothermal vent metagenome TaxID=652676 RepID=A0A3B1BT42_9ZZZZ
MSNELRYISLPNAPVDEADVLILPLPLERTVTYKKGTRLAPTEILRTTDQLEFYDEEAGWSPTKHMKVSVMPVPLFIQGPGPEKFHQLLKEHCATLPADNLLIALGGEHSITPSVIEGRMPGRGTVLFLDAHADLRPCYQGSPYNHACPAYRILSAGHRLVMAGVRSVFEDEARLIDSEERIKMFYDHELGNMETWRAFVDEIKNLKGDVWISVDMDAFDPAIVPGVGTPQPGGLGWRQVVEILEAVFGAGDANVRGMDIVELVPEESKVSQMVAAKLIQKAMSLWGKAGGYDRRPEEGSEEGVEHD